jgi:hypothetical protein
MQAIACRIPSGRNAPSETLGDRGSPGIRPATIASDSGPVIRTIPRAPPPGADEIAAIVSEGSSMDDYQTRSGIRPHDPAADSVSSA